MTQLKPNQKETTNMTGIIKKFIKGFVYSLGILMVISLLCGIIGAIVLGMGEGIEKIDDQGITKNGEGITVYGDGLKQGVICEYLTITGNSNGIIIANDDIKRITITGSDNELAYFDTAKPEIVDNGQNNTLYSHPVGETIPLKAVITPTPTPKSDVEDKIITRFDGQEKHVKCKTLIVPTNGGTIYIENDDIELISVIGNGNMIAYPSSANPEIRDVGSYNEIWGSIWL